MVDQVSYFSIILFYFLQRAWLWENAQQRQNFPPYNFENSFNVLNGQLNFWSKSFAMPFLSQIYGRELLNLKIETRNSKGRSGYTFWLILQKTFAAFSHRKLKVAQIWSTHQSKAMIFYFSMKKFWVGFLKILWETDKVHFTSSNLMCVYTHPKFQNMKFSLSVFDKIFKNPTQKFFMP